MVYDEDGFITDITTDAPRDGERWVETNNEEWQKGFGRHELKYVRVKNGKLVIQTPTQEEEASLALREGNTWHSDKKFRLLAGENGDNTDGWERKDG